MGIEEDRKVQIKNFMKEAFDIEIDDKHIEDYDQALMHYNDQRTGGTREPERLAFLGDAYLEFIVRKYLFNHKDNFSIGDMNIIKTQFVDNDGWREIAQEIGLGEQIVTVQQDHPLHPAERISQSFHPPKILADSFEALAGVLSYDSTLDDAGKKLIDLFIKLGYLPDVDFSWKEL